MNISVVAIAKNEELYIEEWLNAYRKLGVNHFYIFDNNDEGNLSLPSLLSSHKDVSIIDVRGPEKLKSFGYQAGCYKMAYDQLSKDYDYMGFFDIDEFLYLNDKTIPDWLAEHKEFDDTDVIKFNWLYYGDNGLVHYDNRPVQERFKEPCPINTKYAQNFPESLHIKCLVKTGNKMLSATCHTFVLENGKAKSSSGDETPMNSPFVNPPNFKNGFVKHYGTKTIEEYIDRRCKNNKDATGGKNNAENRIKWFFNVNEDTEEKRNFITNYKKQQKINIKNEYDILKNTTLLTCTFNNNLMTKCMLMSFFKQIKQIIPVVIMDNGTKEFCTDDMKDNFIVIDNTNYKLTPNFNQVSRNHCNSIDYALKNCIKTKYVLLCDNDILFKPTINNLFYEIDNKNYDCVGEIGEDYTPPTRLYPFMCLIDVEKMKQEKINYYDDNRILKNPYISNTYDTGCSFYEDIKTKWNIKQINLEDYIVHLKNGTYKGYKKNKNLEWLMENKNLFMEN